MSLTARQIRERDAARQRRFRDLRSLMFIFYADGHHIGTMVAANRREKARRRESLGVPGGLANKGLQDYSGLDAAAEAENSIPAASTTL